MINYPYESGNGHFALSTIYCLSESAIDCYGQSIVTQIKYGYCHCHNLMNCGYAEALLYSLSCDGPLLMCLHQFLGSLVLAATICQDQFGLSRLGLRTGRIHHRNLAKRVSVQFFVVYETPAAGMRMVTEMGHKAQA